MIEKFMCEDEKLRYEIVDRTGSKWLATNKRIIKFKESFGYKIFSDLDYKHIVSIKFEFKKYYELLLIGLISIVIDFIFKVQNEKYGEMGNFIFMIILDVSLLMIVISFLIAKTSCSFYAENGKVFEIYAKGNKLIEFTRNVRQKEFMTEDNKNVIKEDEDLWKKIVM